MPKKLLFKFLSKQSIILLWSRPFVTNKTFKWDFSQGFWSCSFHLHSFSALQVKCVALCNFSCLGQHSHCLGKQNGMMCQHYATKTASGSASMVSSRARSKYVACYCYVALLSELRTYTSPATVKAYNAWAVAEDEYAVRSRPIAGSLVAPYVCSLIQCVVCQVLIRFWSQVDCAGRWYLLSHVN